MDFFVNSLYTECKGGLLMNIFERDVQSKRNDAVDSGVGLFISIGFYTTMFLIGVILQFVGS